MPQQSNFTLFFYIVLFAAILGTFIRQDITDQSSISTMEYGSKLTAASHSAMLAVNTDKIAMGKTIWDTPQMREKSLDAFYTTLGESMWLEQDADMLKTKIPVVILIDEDGYYINYNILFDEGNIPSGMSKEDFIKEALNGHYGIKGLNQLGAINTWAENKSGWAVQYTLEDYVRVVSPDGDIHEGHRKQVANKLEEYGLAPSDVIHFLRCGNSPDDTDGGASNPAQVSFATYRTRFIINEIEKNMNRFVNEFNHYSAGEAGKSGGFTKTRYHINMPTIKSEDWHRMLENPTVLAFMQGDESNIETDKIATYAYSGGELIKTDRYFITQITTAAGEKKLIYHSVREESKQGRLIQKPLFKKDDEGNQILDASGNPILEIDENDYEMDAATGAKIYNTKKEYHYISGGTDITISRFYNTMADAALEDAYPCANCIK